MPTSTLAWRPKKPRVLYELPQIANALLYLLALSSQMGWFEDLFEEDDDDTSLLFPEDSVVSPLFDPTLYDVAVSGTAGADIITAAPGDMTQAYFLSAGNDQVTATDTNDYAQGGSGNDTLTMLFGDDLALGGGGDDILNGGVGNDTLYGNAGDDRLDGSRDDDLLEGGSGHDTLSGGRDNDTLLGGDGNDVLSGDRFDQASGVLRGTDMLDGGAGDDTLRLFGDSIGIGGTGNDLFSIYESDPAQDDADPTLATISDYDANEDAIEVLYIPEAGEPEPVLSVGIASNGLDSEIFLDGAPIARVVDVSDLQDDDIVLSAVGLAS